MDLRKKVIDFDDIAKKKKNIVKMMSCICNLCECLNLGSHTDASMIGKAYANRHYKYYKM